MKNSFLKLVATTFVSLSLFACQNSTPPADPTLGVDPDETIVFTAKGGEKTIEITTNQKTWEVILTPTDGHGWLTCGKEGKTLVLTAVENTKLRDQDPVMLTITAGSATPVTLNVTQQAYSPDPTLTTNLTGEIMFESGGHEQTVRVSTNQPSFDVVLSPADGQGWLSLKSKEDESFILEATANTNSTERGPVTITVTAGEADPVVLLAKQAAALPLLSIDPSGTMTFMADGGDNTVTVTTNCDTWDVALAPADGNGWLSVSKQSGSFTLTAAENKQTTSPAPVTVTVSAGEASPVTFTVKQDGADAPTIYYKVGDYYPDEANAEGVVWYVDPTSSRDGGITGLHGKIVALDTPDAKVLWVSNNLYDMALSREDGEANTAAILAYAQTNGFTLDPLGGMMRVVNKGDGWYMPAFNEHRRLYAVMSGTTFEEMTNPNRKNPAWNPDDPTQQDDDNGFGATNYVPEYLSVWTDYSAMPDKVYVYRMDNEGTMIWAADSDPKYKAARDAFNARFTAKGGQALYNEWAFWWSSTSVETSTNVNTWAFGNPVGNGNSQYRGSTPGAYVRAMKTF